MAIYKNTPPVVTNGLVLYLDATNQQSYISGSTSWYDLAGSSVTASVSSSFFETTNFRITGSPLQQPLLSTPITLTSSSSWTFNILFKSDTITPSTDYFRILDNSTGPDYFKLEWNNRVLSSAGFFFSGFSPGCSLSRGYNDFTLTSTQGTGSVYINGIKTTYNSLQTSDLTFNRIGRSQNTVTPGNISFFRLYNQALTTSEVLQNYNATKARFGLT